MSIDAIVGEERESWRSSEKHVNNGGSLRREKEELEMMSDDRRMREDYKGVWRELGLEYQPLDGGTRGWLRFEACVWLVLVDGSRYVCQSLVGYLFLSSMACGLWFP